jgi:nitrogen fixation-related uncharacterized protein
MNITLVFIVVTVLTVAVFDVWVILKKGKSESISAHAIKGSKKYPLLVLLTGVVIGHLFWSFRTEGLYEDVKCFRYVDGESILIDY